MSLDWIIVDDEEASNESKSGTSIGPKLEPKPEPKPEPQPTPQPEPGTVIKKENVVHTSSPSVLVEAVTIDSLPDYDLTTELPFLTDHQNASIEGVSNGSFIEFGGEKKAHQLGNSTGKLITIIFSRVLWSVGPSICRSIGPLVV